MGFSFYFKKTEKRRNPEEKMILYYENDDGVSSFMNKKQLVFIYLFFSFFWFGFLDWSWFLKLEGRGGVDLQVRMDENERVALQQFRAKGEERMRVFSGHFGTPISNLFFSFLLSVLYFLNALVLTDFSKERKSSVSLCLLSLLCSAKNVTHDTTPPFFSFTLYAIDRL